MINSNTLVRRCAWLSLPLPKSHLAITVHAME